MGMNKKSLGEPGLQQKKTSSSGLTTWIPWEFQQRKCLKQPHKNFHHFIQFRCFFWGGANLLGDVFPVFLGVCFPFSCFPLFSRKSLGFCCIFEKCLMKYKKKWNHAKRVGVPTNASHPDSPFFHITDKLGAKNPAKFMEKKNQAICCQGVFFFKTPQKNGSFSLFNHSSQTKCSREKKNLRVSIPFCFPPKKITWRLPKPSIPVVRHPPRHSKARRGSQGLSVSRR